MNVLLFEDLFLTICDYFNMKQMIKLELLSKDHSRLIRKTPWSHNVVIENTGIMNHVIKNYQFKTLHIWLYIDVNLYIDYLKHCHTLRVTGTNITDESVKQLKNCHTLFLSLNNITDESVKTLKNCHTLHLSHNNTDESVKELNNCHTLSLTDTKITDESVKMLNCKILTLFNTNVTDECIKILRLTGCIVYK